MLTAPASTAPEPSAQVTADPPRIAMPTPREPHTDRAVAAILVVIPTYNERDNLELILGRVRAAVPQAHVLIVDDGSPDGTGQLADHLADHDRNVHVMHRTEKAGLGAAYLAGFDWALDHGYDTVVEMDADGSHAPEQLPQLLAALDHADLALGSRYIPGGELQNWPRRRELLSRWGNRYAKLCLGVPVNDITGGYRAFRRHVLETLPLDQVSSQGYCFQVELAWRAHQSGFRLTEVPITFTERAIGESKMSGNIVREALLKITRWGLRRNRSAIQCPAHDATPAVHTYSRGTVKTSTPSPGSKPPFVCPETLE